jgi:hypothetical protein
MRNLFDVIETRLLRRPGWLPQPAAPAIRVSSTSFAVNGRAVPWHVVSRIEAWRDRDGDICLDIGADIDACVITVSESQRGFDDFVAMADRKMTFPLGWWDQLGGPRRRGLTLFERLTHG